MMTEETVGTPALDDFEIVLIGIEEKSFFLYKGEGYINQLLMGDGDFPKPVRCLHFDSVLDVKLQIGVAVNTSQYWGIHPSIVARLRDNGEMIETGI